MTFTLQPVRADECPLCGLPNPFADDRRQPEVSYCTPLSSPGCWAFDSRWNPITRTWEPLYPSQGDSA